MASSVSMPQTSAPPAPNVVSFLTPPPAVAPAAAVVPPPTAVVAPTTSPYAQPAATPPPAAVVPPHAAPGARTPAPTTHPGAPRPHRPSGEFNALEADFFAREAELYKEDGVDSFDDLDHAGRPRR